MPRWITCKNKTALQKEGFDEKYFSQIYKQTGKVRAQPDPNGVQEGDLSQLLAGCECREGGKSAENSNSVLRGKDSSPIL